MRSSNNGDNANATGQYASHLMVNCAKRTHYSRHTSFVVPRFFDYIRIAHSRLYVSTSLQAYSLFRFWIQSFSQKCFFFAALN